MFFLLRSISNWFSLPSKGGSCSCTPLVWIYIDESYNFPPSLPPSYKVSAIYSILSFNCNKDIASKYLLSKWFTTIYATWKRGEARRLVIDLCGISKLDPPSRIVYQTCRVWNFFCFLSMLTFFLSIVISILRRRIASISTIVLSFIYRHPSCNNWSILYS